MRKEDIAKYSQLSPFEQKNALIALTTRDSEMMMLNAATGDDGALLAVLSHGRRR